MKSEQISAEIERVEKQLSELRGKLKEANNYKNPCAAKIGDKLDDGSIVVKTYENAILVISPQETEVPIQYDEDFSAAFLEMLNHNKFKVSEWFAPSLDILYTAMVNVPEVFEIGKMYWIVDANDKKVNCTMAFVNQLLISIHTPAHNSIAYQRLFRFIGF